MIVLEVLATIRLGFEFGIKLLEYLMTEDGKAWAKTLRENQANWDKTLAGVGTWLNDFFTGKLFEKKTEP